MNVVFVLENLFDRAESFDQIQTLLAADASDAITVVAAHQNAQIDELIVVDLQTLQNLAERVLPGLVVRFA